MRNVKGNKKLSAGSLKLMMLLLCATFFFSDFALAQSDKTAKLKNSVSCPIQLIKVRARFWEGMDEIDFLQIRFKNATKKQITALVIEFTFYDTWGEVIGTKGLELSGKIFPGEVKNNLWYSSVSGADGTESFTAEVTKVKFADGKFWKK